MTRSKTEKKWTTVTTEVVYGAHPIIEVLKAKRRRVTTLYTTKPEPRSWSRIKEYLPERLPQINIVTKDVLDRLTHNAEHMGVVAMVGQFPYRSKMFDPARHPFLVLIDSVQDVRNLGAILRTAYTMGVDGIVLAKTNAAPLNAASLKASAGLAEHLEIYQASSLKGALVDLKKAGYNLYMAVLEGGVDACAVEYKSPMVLVIGNEEKGITKEIQSQGTLITLPQRAPDISYNASVAAGMLMLVLKHGLTRKQ